MPEDRHPKERSPQAEFDMKRWVEEAEHIVCIDCGCGGGRHLQNCPMRATTIIPARRPE